MQKDIKSYCSPTVSSKRIRPTSSPELEGHSHKKKSTSSKMGIDEEVMRKLLQESESRLSSNIDVKLVKLKEDFQQAVSSLKTVVDEVLSENKELKIQISQLSNTNNVLLKRVIGLEDRGRRNNLIFKGLKYSVNTQFNAVNVVKNFCNQYLGSRPDVWINRAHPLGPARDGGPLIAHFPDDSDVTYILNNAKKLKGTGFFVHKDFSAETRKARAKLFVMKKEVIRIRPNEKVMIRHDRLIIRNVSFEIDEEGMLKSGDQDGEKKLLATLGKDAETVLTALRVADQQRREATSDEKH
jgi:hypothetical protein